MCTVLITPNAYIFHSLHQFMKWKKSLGKKGNSSKSSRYQREPKYYSSFLLNPFASCAANYVFLAKLTHEFYSLQFWQSNEWEYMDMFHKMVSNFSNQRRDWVAKLGFESFLQFSGLCNIDEVFIWLVNHFDTSTATIELENGFSFPITPLTIHKILGIPLGGFPIQTEPTTETCDFIRKEINMETPSVEHLFSLLSENLEEDKFCRVFMLIVLSVFIAPNSEGVASRKFYSALVNIEAVAKHDWCLFTISNLVYSINEARIEKINGKDIFPRGCKLALVVSHWKRSLNVLHTFG